MQRENFKTMTDGQLALRFQSQEDAGAFGELYRRHFNRLFQYCNSILHQPEEAADVAQDTFTRAAEKIQHLKSPALFSSWLFRIAHNACMDQLKFARKTQALPDEPYQQLADVGFDLESALQYEARLGQLHLLLEELSPESRALLFSKYCEGSSIEELTKAWGISESAIKMRLSRARHRMLKLYSTSNLAS